MCARLQRRRGLRAGCSAVAGQPDCPARAARLSRSDKSALAAPSFMRCAAGFCAECGLRAGCSAAAGRPDCVARAAQLSSRINPRLKRRASFDVRRVSAQTRTARRLFGDAGRPDCLARAARLSRPDKSALAMPSFMRCAAGFSADADCAPVVRRLRTTADCPARAARLSRSDKSALKRRASRDARRASAQTQTARRLCCDGAAAERDRLRWIEYLTDMRICVCPAVPPETSACRSGNFRVLLPAARDALPPFPVSHRLLRYKGVFFLCCSNGTIPPCG